MQRITDTDDGVLDLVDTIDALGPGDELGFDVETFGPSIEFPGGDEGPDPYRARIVGMSVATSPDVYTYVPVRHRTGDPCVSESAMRDLIAAILRAVERGVRCWAHGLTYELNVFRNEGFPVEDSSKFDDSMVAAWLAQRPEAAVNRGDDDAETALGLKPLRVAMGLPARPEYRDVVGDRDIRDVPVAEIAEYAGLDAADAISVGLWAWEGVQELRLERHYREVDMPCVEPLRAMEAAGLPINVAKLAELEATFKERSAEYRARFEEITATELLLPVKLKEHHGEFYKNGNPKLVSVTKMLPHRASASPGNDGQVSRWMYEELKWWPTAKLKRNKKGLFPVGKEFVQDFTLLPGSAGEAAQLRLDYQKVTKLASTYTTPMQALANQYADGRVHPRFKLCGTATQRLSSSGPNMQNCPARSAEGKLIRMAIEAPPGEKIVVVDMNQAELRVAGHLSQDEELVLCYLLDEDVHAGTLAALRTYWKAATRTDAKVTNFSSLYNITAKKLAVKMRCPVERAEQALDAFNKRFAGYVDWKERCYQYVIDRGYMQTVDGYRRRIAPALAYDRFVGGVALHWQSRNQAPNTAVQGSVAGFAKMAMVRIHAKWRDEGILRNGVVLIAQEHDSLVAQAKNELAERVGRDMVEIVERVWPALRVPMKADLKIGQSWGACK
jgi:DNA polymerase-1